MPHADPDRLRAIKTFPQLVKYLRDELEWPIGSEDFDDLTFDYSPEELGLDPKTAVKVKEIKQLRPISSRQPWGIFFLQFEPKRLPVVVLRRILQALVLRKRASAAKAHQAAWHLNDLLFISSYGESDHRDISFAHFAEEEDSALPTLRVLGWDDEDTVLHLDHAHKTLQEKLRWPEGDTDIKAWRERWASAFTLRHREVITTSRDMAIRLAHLATAIRKRVNQILAVETEQGALRQLMKGFREALIHDLTEDDFADMYAQTVTYGLLTARISQPMAYASGGLTDLPITNPFLRDLLSQFMRVGGRKGKLDFDELGIHEVVQTLLDADMPAVLRDFGDKNPQEDPVINFYELFLKEYDPKKRTSRGVFYTPRPVVSYIVRSVHELLQTEFGLEDGLADTATWGDMQKRFKDLKLPPNAKASDPFVRILDIATGTGTFLVECIEVIHQTMVAKWKKEGHYDQKVQDLWNDYVPKHLLPRLYGFELMMAPYAIAHMKVGLKLLETGYRVSADERARVYLTNSLEPPSEVPQRMLFEETALAHEAQAVNAVKKNVPFTVVIGNPPYSLVSSNMGPQHRSLVERYKFVGADRIKERGALQLEKILNDDYVKFIAKSQSYIEDSHAGILGVITNHAYLDNPTMRGMRHNLLSSFHQAFVYDLGGSAKKVDSHVDGNVFDIQQGVAVCILVRKNSTALPKRRHAKLAGTREAKYQALQQVASRTVQWSDLDPKPPHYLLVPTDYGLRSEYERYFSLPDAFSCHSIGLFTSKDHFVISRDARQLASNAWSFRNSRLADDELCRSLSINPKDAWNVGKSRERLRKMTLSDIENRVVPFTHRPFDSKFIFYDRSLVWSLAYPINRNMLGPGNLALVTSRQLATPPWRHVFCSDRVVEMFLMSNKTKEGNHVFPLHLCQDDEAGQRRLTGDGVQANMTEFFLREILLRLGLPEALVRSTANAISAMNIFCYIYAIFHSTSFRSRYEEFLKIDFPRIPLTSSLPLFRALAKLGLEIVALHLMEFLLEDEKPKNPAAKEWPVYPRLTEFTGKVPSLEIEKVSYDKKTVWLDKAQSVGFKGVPEEVWEFHIGGYQVCNKWLKDRKGRRLMADDVLHYHKIVTALSNTIRLMKDIDKVIEKHGGWPGAFMQ